MSNYNGFGKIFPKLDFVAKNRNGLKYYQVALSVRDEKILERELKSLQKTGDYYPKYLITLDMDLESITRE